ncbi:uncharacterized protein LOC133953442 [Platichthys flesus]|uniref:uncharacterized protein LOC133953442 n=1 Tax=Platichthys flesus TaxID=8260 RepID=UPI002DBF528D|nr:uncharacterized protein LOC133953442 [Platichthys flesus]
MHSGKASPIIIYDREQLLSIGLMVKNTFSPPPTTNKGDYPWRGLPAVPGTRRRGRRKRGSRAGVLVRLRKRENRPPLPSILLANVQSLDNKLDELRSRMAFQRDIKFCNVMVFTETWLDPSIPDTAIVPKGVSIHRQDRTTNSGCTPDLEHLMIRCRPYYIQREFTSVILIAVYIPSSADTNQALDELHAVIDRTETSRPEAVFIVAGDFNNAKMRKVLPRYFQHISCPTRGANTPDHVYTPFRGAYKALPRPPFGKSDHVSVLLLPFYRQKVKRDRPVTRTIQQWTDQSDSALQDCFKTT